MSTRERWIVYPLLFLALGIELRDKMVPCSQIQTAEVMAKQIRCEQLQVGQIFCDRVEAGQSVCRSLAIAGPDGQPVVRAGADNRGCDGVIEILSTHQQIPLLQLYANEGCGMLTIVDRSGKSVVLGCIEKNYGLFATMPKVGVVALLTPPWRFDKPTIVPKDKTAPSTPAKQPPEKPLDKKEHPPAEKK